MQQVEENLNTLLKRFMQGTECLAVEAKICLKTGCVQVLLHYEHGLLIGEKVDFQLCAEDLRGVMATMLTEDLDTLVTPEMIKITIQGQGEFFTPKEIISINFPNFEASEEPSAADRAAA